MRDDAALSDAGVDVPSDRPVVGNDAIDGASLDVAVMDTADGSDISATDVVDAPDVPGADATVDAGIDATPPPGACDTWLSGAIECQDFESGRIPATWTSVGTVDISTVFAEDLTSVAVDRGMSYLQQDRASRWMDKSFYVRASIYIPAGAPLLSTPILVLRGGGEFINFSLIDGRPVVWASASGFSDNREEAVTRDRWACISVEVGLGTGRIRASIDGMAVGSTSDVTTISDVDRIAVGLINTVSAGSTIYVDNIAYGSSSLPCAP